jgi:hypothetical protein
MISSAAYIQKLDEGKKFAKEGSAKVVAQFRRGVVCYFG